MSSIRSSRSSLSVYLLAVLMQGFALEMAYYMGSWGIVDYRLWALVLVAVPQARVIALGLLRSDE